MSRPAAVAGRGRGGRGAPGRAGEAPGEAAAVSAGPAWGRVWAPRGGLLWSRGLRSGPPPGRRGRVGTRGFHTGGAAPNACVVRGRDTAPGRQHRLWPWVLIGRLRIPGFTVGIAHCDLPQGAAKRSRHRARVFCLWLKTQNKAMLQQKSSEF